jgi:hypothetical protein
MKWFLVGFVGGQEYIRVNGSHLFIHLEGKMFWIIVCFAKLPLER